MKKQARYNHRPIAAYIWKSLYREYGRKGYKELLKSVTKRWHRAQGKEICREVLAECVTVEREDTTQKRK